MPSEHIDKAQELQSQVKAMTHLAGREQTPKEMLERKIELMERRLQDFRSLYRALPDEMGFEASRALRHLIENL